MINFKTKYIGVDMERSDIWELAIMLTDLMIFKANNFQFTVTNVQKSIYKLKTGNFPCFTYIETFYSFLERTDKIDEFDKRLEKIFEDKLVSEEDKPNDQ